MQRSSARTVVVFALLLHNLFLFAQNPDCPHPTFFKLLGTETGTEYGTVLCNARDGNLFLAGRNGNKSFIQKTSPAGDVIWYKEFQINPFEPINLIQLIEDSEGMLVGCGTQSQFAGVTRSFVFRYDPVADVLLWSHPYASANPVAAGVLEKSPGSSFLLYQNLNPANLDNDVEILDLDRATGNIIQAFASRYQFLSQDGIRKMLTVNGSVFALGYLTVQANPTADARRVWLSRIDPINGMPIWSQVGHLDTSAHADFIPRDMVADGDSLVSVYVGDEDTDDLTPSSFVYVQKTDLNGQLIWLKKYDISTLSASLMVVADGYIISGQRQFGSRYFAVKIDKNGNIIWGKQLNYGPTASLNTSTIGPNISAAIGDSLYFTGIAAGNIPDVIFWKMMSDGTMIDSCGYLDTFAVQGTPVLDPVITQINVNELLSSAEANNSNFTLTSNSLEEKMLCPDCSVPNPCPEGHDFVADIESVACSNGFVRLNFSVCDLRGGALPDLDVTFYNGNPYLSNVDKLGVYHYNGSGTDSCASLQIANLDNFFGAGVISDGVVIYAVANDFGTVATPFLFPDDFPIGEFEECDYFNNADSLVIDLPSVPTLSLGPDQNICSNQQAILDAGAGYFKYQWSNGATTQFNSISFAGQYRLTVTDFCGYRQFDTINITVLQVPLYTENLSFCPGKSVSSHGFTFDHAGTFQRTLTGLSGQCDTAATFFVTERDYNERIEIVNFCPFTTVTINGVTYEDSGLALDTIPSTNSCDTIIFYFLNQLPLPFRNIQLGICPGDTAYYKGQPYTQPTTFTDTLYSSGFGCDTIMYVAVAFLPHAEIDSLVRFCPGSSVEINGITYDQPGQTDGTLPSSTGGCDTLVHYTLEWLPAPELKDTIRFCQGNSVIIGGNTYTQPGTAYLTIPGSGSGCDTLVTYTLEWLPTPSKAESISFCQGGSVTINGVVYTQPGTVTGTIQGSGADCDTLVTYTLAWLPTPTRSETVTFCPGTTVTIHGTSYSQPGTVNVTVAGTNGGCDTLVTYTLQFGPLPTRDETLEFCQGESVSLGGQSYSQPGTVTLTHAGAGNDCDTLVSYHLQYLTPGPSTMSLICPAAINVATTPGTGAVAVNYDLPIVNSDCECSGNDLHLSSGPASGSLFPVTTTQVCYTAQDKCGSTASCCFTVTVREELPCDVKVNGCIKYELISITSNPDKQYTYTIRVTNNCANKFIYTAIQLPDGLTALEPANLSVYTSPDGRKYQVRNPNYSPFYSLRFKSTTDSISNGQSEVFSYTLPAQAHPTFIDITTRLANQQFYEAHMNTFNCPIGVTPTHNKEREGVFSEVHGLTVFPNPSSGALYADLTRWQGSALEVRVIDSRGQAVQNLHLTAESEAQAIPLAESLSSGLYFLEIMANEEREVVRFVIQRH